MNLKKSVRNSLFAKSFSLAKSNPGKIGLMILFDALFVVSFFILKNFFDYFANQFSLPTTAAAFYIFLVFSFIYYLVVLLVYSFFKYSVLGFVKSLFAKSNFSIARLWDFYILNVIIAGIFFAIMIGLNLILASVKQSYSSFLFIFLAIPYLLFFYANVNIAHSHFYEKNSIFESLKKSFRITFTKMNTYRETILLLIFAALALWLLFLGGGYLVRYFTSGNYTAYLSAYSSLREFSLIFADAILYLAIIINRISFYAAINYKKGK